MITPRTIVPTSLRKSGQLWTRFGLGASTCRAMAACCQGGAAESTASSRMPDTGPAFCLWNGLFPVKSLAGAGMSDFFYRLPIWVAAILVLGAALAVGLGTSFGLRRLLRLHSSDD